MKIPRCILITGSGHGLGLEWARQEIAEGSVVIATARDPENAPDLARLATEAGARLLVLPMDVTDDRSVERAAREVARRFGAIDTLVNNAGVGGTGEGPPLKDTTETLRRVLEVNAVGSYRVTRAFLPLLRKGNGKKIAFVTSRMGSLQAGAGGGYYPYRISKAALNMLGANLAEDLKGDGFICLVLHPGWVRTKMGGKKAPLSPEESVAGMRRVVARATKKKTGAFLDWNGETVPW